jgi:hypothetical protein
MTSRLRCAQVLVISRVTFRLFLDFPQKSPVFPGLCPARAGCSRFFDRHANTSGFVAWLAVWLPPTCDSEDVHELLSGKGIKPLIRMRSLWETEPERLLPGHDGTSNVVYDEAGTIYCYDKVSEPQVRHRMSNIGYEPERETLKYRCPAKHEGWECPMSEVCNAGKRYGKTVRVPREVDPRRFPALPRATKSYKGRTAVERVNARLKIFRGVDDGNVTGSRRFVAEVGVVHAAFATLLAWAPRREGTLGKVRLGAIAEALRAQSKSEPAGSGSRRARRGDAKTRGRRDNLGSSTNAPQSVPTSFDCRGARSSSRVAGRPPASATGPTGCTRRLASGTTA